MRTLLNSIMVGRLHVSFKALFACGLLSAAGCATLPDLSGREYVDPIGSSPTIENSTQYSVALDCLGKYFADRKINLQRFAVGRVEDYTGKADLVNGKRVTQGASLMVISALSRTRVPLVERLDFAIGETEIRFTDVQLVGEDTNQSIRKNFGGIIMGSDYFVVGGITEVNYNIRSGALDGSVKFLSGGARYAVLDVGLDLRMVNTKTLQVVKVSSLRKQIIGTEVRLGYFRFFNDKVVDLSAAERAQEPIQRAIRMLTETAVYEMLADLYSVPSNVCPIPTVTAEKAVQTPASKTKTSWLPELIPPSVRQVDSREPAVAAPVSAARVNVRRTHDLVKPSSAAARTVDSVSKAGQAQTTLSNAVGPSSVANAPSPAAMIPISVPNPPRPVKPAELMPISRTNADASQSVTASIAGDVTASIHGLKMSHDLLGKTPASAALVEAGP